MTLVRPYCLLLSLFVQVGISFAQDAPSVQPPAKVRLSGGVVAGNKLTGVPPMYPAEAKAQHISGAVVMHAYINTEGKVSRLEVVSGPELLRDAATDAVSQWTYRPYLLNGVPTEVDTTITVNFILGPGIPAAPPRTVDSVTPPR